MQLTNELSPIDFLRLLRLACAAAGGQARFAEKIGVTPAYVSAVMSGGKAPSERMLAAAKIRRVVTYEIIEEAA